MNSIYLSTNVTRWFVGIAMGFAVIPTIFSITEDAIFAVPKHLSYGSLALGANPLANPHTCSATHCQPRHISLH